MDITAAQVDEIESVRSFVDELIDYAAENETDELDIENLVILEAQLDVLHQGLSAAVAQKRQVRDAFGNDSQSESAGDNSE